MTPIQTALIRSALALIDACPVAECQDIARILHQIPIHFAPLPGYAMAQYRHEQKDIRLTTQPGFNEDPVDVAANLYHEGKHALDDSLGILSKETIGQYVQSEVDAANAEMRFWHQPGVNQDHTHPVVNKFEQSEAIKDSMHHSGQLDSTVKQRYMQLLLGLV